MGDSCQSDGLVVYSIALLIPEGHRMLIEIKLLNWHLILNWLTTRIATECMAIMKINISNTIGGRIDHKAKHLKSK